MKKLKKMVLNTTAEVLSSNQMRQMLGGGSSGYNYGYYYFLSCHGVYGPFNPVYSCSSGGCDYMEEKLCVTVLYTL